MGKISVGIVGGGIAGMETALKLEKKGFEVDVYDYRKELLFYPGSHRVIEGYSPEKISINYQKKFEGRNISHIQKEVTRIDPKNREIYTENSSKEYNYLVIAVGAETNYFGLEKGHTETLKYRDDLCDIREQILENEINDVVIVGAGPTGVEAAAALQEAREKENAKFKIRLIDSSERILSRQTEKMSKKASKHLKSKGIQIQTNTRVKGIEPHWVCTTDGEEYNSDEVIWAGGLKKHSLIENSNLPQDKSGVKVDQFQRAEGFENVYAVGDCASYPGSKARALYALFEAKNAAKNIKKSNKQENLKPRNIPYDPIIIYLGGNCSALQIGKIVLTGLTPSLMEKIGVEKRYMLTRKHLL